MRLKIGRIVNTEADVNLADLTPLDRIVSASINAYHNTALYKRRFAESEERKEEQKRKIREALIDHMIVAISSQLERNELLAKKDDVCVGVLIEVPARFTSYLFDVLSAHEFDAYDLTVVHPDILLKKNSKPPYLVYVKNKGG